MSKNKRVRYEEWKQKYKIYPPPAESYILEMNKTPPNPIGSKPQEFLDKQ